jgi:hypothetical protein
MKRSPAEVMVMSCVLVRIEPRSCVVVCALPVSGAPSFEALSS